MSLRRRLTVSLLVALLLGLGGWLAFRFLLLPAGESTLVQLSPGANPGVRLWLQFSASPSGAVTFDVLDLDIPRQQEGAATICFSRLGFSQETFLPLDVLPSDYFSPVSPALGYSRAYMRDSATGLQGQSASYDLINVCNTVNPALSTYNAARILAPEVVADAEARRVLVGLARDHYFYPFDRLVIPLTVEISGIVLDTQPVQRAGLIPELLAVVEAPEWRVGVEPNALVLTRSLAEQLLTLVIMTLAVTFIAALWFVKGETELMGAALGILLGLTGVRDALLPDFVTWTTIVDRLIVLMVVLLAGVVAAWVVKRRLRRSDD